MEKYSIAMALALLLPIPATAPAAVVYASGQGQSYGPGTALENARADAVGKCTAQAGTPVAEVYNHWPGPVSGWPVPCGSAKSPDSSKQRLA